MMTLALRFMITGLVEIALFMLAVVVGYYYGLKG